MRGDPAPRKEERTEGREYETHVISLLWLEASICLDKVARFFAKVVLQRAWKGTSLSPTLGNDELEANDTV